MQLRLLTLTTPLAAISLGVTPAHANDLGCQVLLCLSNPGGATQYDACIKPMTQLWQSLTTGRAFPDCSGGGVARTKVYDRDSDTRRRVVVAYVDGRQQTYSLANIERLAQAAADAPGGTPK